MSSSRRHRVIPGVTAFDGRLAQRGYALNRMCFSLNRAENRAAMLRDERGYCARYGLTPQQYEAVRRRDVLALLEAGGNINYVANLASCPAPAGQAAQAGQAGQASPPVGGATGVTSAAEFRQRLRAAGAHLR